MTDTSNAALVERLRKVRYVYEYDGNPCGSIEDPDKVAAADLIDALSSARSAAIEECAKVVEAEAHEMFDDIVPGDKPGAKMHKHAIGCLLSVAGDILALDTPAEPGVDRTVSEMERVATARAEALAGQVEKLREALKLLIQYADCDVFDGADFRKADAALQETAP